MRGSWREREAREGRGGVNVTGGQLVLSIGKILAAFIGSPVASMIGGMGWGVVVAGVLFLTDLVPARRRYFFEQAGVKIGAMQWRFHLSWIALWLAVIFGSWVFLGGTTRYWLWAALLFPVFIFEMAVCYTAPFMSVARIWVESGENCFRFFAFGTWWGDRVEFQESGDGQLELETCSEVARVYIRMNPRAGMRERVYRWDDGVLVGKMPGIVSVRNEYFGPGGKKKEIAEMRN